MPVGAAIGIGSAVGGIASAVGASNAAGQQSKAARQASDTQLGMFNQTRSDLAPYRALGSAAAPIYSRLLGIPDGGMGAATAASSNPNYSAYVQNNPDVLQAYNTIGVHQGTPMEDFGKWHWDTFGHNEFNGGDPNRVYTPFGTADALRGSAGAGGAPGVFDSAAVQSALEATPGYQFTRDQGMQGVNFGLTAKGLGGVSGSLGKGLARFVTGLADQTYEKRLADVAGAVGTGQSAAAQTGQFGIQTGQSIGSNIIGAGNAQAAGTLGVANAFGNAANGAAGGYVSSRILGMYGPSQGAIQSFSNNYASAPEFY